MPTAIPIVDFTGLPPEAVYPPVEKGTLYVDTAPIKGGISVDGDFCGFAPVTLSLSVGSHVVSFSPVSVVYITPPEQTVQIIAGQTTTVMGIYEKSIIPPVEDLIKYVAVGGGLLFLLWALLSGEK